MTDQNQEFRPEMVEEQLEQLANDLHNLSQAAEPEKRMVQQLYRLYQANRKDDAASVERVWQRLQQKMKQDQIGIISEYGGGECSVR